MDFSNILPTLGTLAPSIATALGGPLAGMAVQQLERLFGLDPSREEPARRQKLVEAVQGLTPDQALALRKADADFAARMKELEIDLEQIAAGDRDSARQRESQTRDWTPRVLALLVTCGFFGVLAFVLLRGVPREAGGDALLVMLGALGAAWTAICNYYYGSSAGSHSKNEVLAAALKR